MNTPNVITVFYSWQSDLPRTTNQELIRLALKSSVPQLESEFSDKNLRINIDEATRGEAGATNIPQAIIRKISDADIFVCDITTINSGATTGERKTPNPNVVFELGYAVSQLGWERVILLFNKARGEFPDDLPFDFDRHRATPYNATSVGNGEQQQLSKDLVVALEGIIRADPTKPFRSSGFSPDEIKRKRDIENLQWLLSSIHIPTLDKHIKELPYKIHAEILLYWEDFVAIVQSNHFYIYDSKAKSLVDEIYQTWGETLSYGHCYREGLSDVHLFGNSEKRPLSKEQEKCEKIIITNRNRLNKAFSKLLSHVRNKYLELNVDKQSEVAFKYQQEWKKQYHKQIHGDD